jgi:hypothetical protein
MKSMLGIPVLYETVVEHSSLRGVSDAEGAEADCCVTLAGDVDDVWCDAFHQFGVDSNGFFNLDPTKRSVSFHCRTRDNPSEMDSVLEMLDTIVDLTNRLASATAYFDGNLGLSDY